MSTVLAVTPTGHQGSNGTSKAETSHVGSYFFTDEDLSTQNDPAINAPDDDYATAVRKKSDKVQTKKKFYQLPVVRGKQDFTVAGSRQLKAVPREQRLTAYVGRLAKDTTADELTAFLQNEGLDGITCRRLQAKNGRQFSTAAFFVSCPETHRSKFYDENIWPSGAELRDWVFYNS